MTSHGFGVQESIATSTAVSGDRTDANKTEWGQIKVDQGGKNFHEEEQIKLVGCSPASRRGPSRTGRCSASELAGQRPALPVVGARRDENLVKLMPIKEWIKGEIFFPERGSVTRRSLELRQGFRAERERLAV